MTSKDRFIKPCRVFFKQLLRPFSYLAICHKYKKIMDWVFPGLLTLLTAVIILLYGKEINLYGSSGVLSRILGFIQSLPGFYIAALAAIATFGRSDIDNMIPEPTPLIIEVRGGEEQLIPLTRRRFLSMMFAFLTAESVLLTLIIIFLLTTADAIGAHTFFGKEYLGITGFILFMLFFYQMIFTTFWGLYYLGEKIHKVE